VPHKAVDFTGCQLALSGAELAKVLCGYLTQPLRIDVLYGNTSRCEPSRGPRVLAKLYEHEQASLAEVNAAPLRAL
jgi:hypothetical protein